jgi:hypothetical protein
MSGEGTAINNEEFAVLCDIVGGHNRKWLANLNTEQKLALDHLIENGFVKRSDRHSLVKYWSTDKTDVLFRSTLHRSKRWVCLVPAMVC